MPRAQEGVWVEFNPDTLTITRVYSSENGALRAAVKNRNDVTKLPYGLTLEEWIADSASRVEEPPAEDPKRSEKRVSVRKPARDDDQADPS